MNKLTPIALHISHILISLFLLVATPISAYTTVVKNAGYMPFTHAAAWSPDGSLFVAASMIESTPGFHTYQLTVYSAYSHRALCYTQVTIEKPVHTITIAWNPSSDEFALTTNMGTYIFHVKEYADENDDSCCQSPNIKDNDCALCQKEVVSTDELVTIEIKCSLPSCVEPAVESAA